MKIKNLPKLYSNVLVRYLEQICASHYDYLGTYYVRILITKSRIIYKLVKDETFSAWPEKKQLKVIFTNHTVCYSLHQDSFELLSNYFGPEIFKKFIELKFDYKYIAFQINN